MRSTSAGLVPERGTPKAWPGFQALQAPFLITNNELLSAVMTNPMAAEMLAGFKNAEVEDGLVSKQLGHPE